MLFRILTFAKPGCDLMRCSGCSDSNTLSHLGLASGSGCNSLSHSGLAKVNIIRKKNALSSLLYTVLSSTPGLNGNEALALLSCINGNEARGQ